MSNEMKINVEVGSLRCTDGHGTGDVAMHATGRKLETKVQAFPGNPEENRAPFDTLEFEVDGGRVTLFLTEEQLADVRLSIQEHEEQERITEGCIASENTK